MFGAFKKFLAEKVVGQDSAASDSIFEAVEVSSPDFWPLIILRCRQEWPELDDQPGI